jgi:hypothetical protein
LALDSICEGLAVRCAWNNKSVFFWLYVLLWIYILPVGFGQMTT